jgi:5,10-methylenetetrahydrofolate reductase
MRSAADKGADHEKAEGLLIARELAAGIAACSRGIHLMPMAKYDLVPAILDALPSRSRGVPR